MLLGFAILTFYIHPYNYQRINRIQVTVLSASGIIIMFSSLYEFFNENVYLYILFFPCTCLTLIGLILWMQKSKEFFIPDNNENIPNLIQFQFGAGTRVDTDNLDSS